jgi:hypothetical protein
MIEAQAKAAQTEIKERCKAFHRAMDERRRGSRGEYGGRDRGLGVWRAAPDRRRLGLGVTGGIRSYIWYVWEFRRAMKRLRLTQFLKDKRRKRTASLTKRINDR